MIFEPGRFFNSRCAIKAVSAHSVTIDTGDGETEFEFSEIERARLVPDYEQGKSGS